MSDEAKIAELMEEVLDSDRAIEDVCALYPQLLAEVRKGLANVKAVEAQIQSLFPDPLLTPPLTSGPSFSFVLPSIPGYEVLSVLGRGGMGVVYKVRQLNLNRVIALKMLLAGATATPYEHLRFVREAEAVASLQHPNIVPIYEVGDVEGRPYFTMEYVPGGTLADQLVEMPLSIRDAAKLLAILAQAVDSAHQRGIIHRDLKPANILMAHESGPKISDFGLARRLDGDAQLTLTGTRVGTPAYMAPEQIIGANSSIGPAADIYALGAMLYEMLTGQPPFRSESAVDSERRALVELPTPPARLNKKVPRDLETICLKCLEKTPIRRYETAGHLADDLERFLRNEAISARPISSFERAVRWTGRNRLTASLIAMAIALSVLLAVDALQEWSIAAQQQAEKQRLTSRMESGMELEKLGRFAEAKAVLGRLGDGGFDDLREQINGALEKLAILEQLDAIAANRMRQFDDRYDIPFSSIRADTLYEKSFARLGIHPCKQQISDGAKIIANSEVRALLVAALDDWAGCAQQTPRRNWLLEAARRADVNASSWHERVREPTSWTEPQTLAQLAASADQVEASVQLLRTLGDRLDRAGLDSIPLRRNVQQRFTDSFMANLALADALKSGEPAEAVRYYQAALALRPQSALAHNGLAAVLDALGRREEAAMHLHKSLELEPDFAIARFNLGVTYAAVGHHQRAALELERAAAMLPNVPPVFSELGATHLALGNKVQASQALTKCLSLLAESDPLRPQVVKLLESCRAAER